MKYDLFFELAKKAGIKEAELTIGSTYSLSFSLFHSEVDNYENNNGYFVHARGIVNGKMGTASCDVWNKNKASYLVNEIIKNAKVIESDDPVFIFKGSEKYKKVSTYNKELPTISIDKKMKLLYDLEKKIKESDKRISEVETVVYEETMETLTIMNSHGLNLKQKSNYFIYYGGAVAQVNGQTKTGGEIFIDNDFSKFNVDELAKKIANEALSKLNGTPCASSTYIAVLSPDVVSALLKAYIGSADAEEVQKKSSLFVGKLNEKVASSKVTILDMPLNKTIFARWFDDEGVACYNKPIVKNGKLVTYLYNLTTAAKDNVTTTGNGFKAGSKVGINSVCLTMKPGKLTQDQLFEEVKNGVYITEVQGLHAGLNPQSGNFSLQSTGFRIESGKLGQCLDIITISGNLVKLFKSITKVGNDQKLFSSGVICPSVIINKINVSGN